MLVCTDIGLIDDNKINKERNMKHGKIKTCKSKRENSREGC